MGSGDIYYKVIMASVKQAWIRKYGEEEGLRRFNEHKKNYGRTKEQLRAQHGDAYVDSLIQKKATHSLQYHIDRYGEEEGRKKWDAIIKKKTETQRLRRASGVKYKNGRTLEEYQEKYGIEDGYSRWLARNKNQSYKVSKQRYLDEYGEEGHAICKQIKDNSSLEVFIKKYGEADGKRRYEEKCKKSAITEERLVQLYGEDIGSEKYKKWLLAVTQTRAQLFQRGFSKASQRLFWAVYETLSENYKKECYFAELNAEYQFYVNHEGGYPNKIIRVDFKCGNAIIEFDGAYWHQQTKQLDEQRDLLLTTKGYYIKRVSEDLADFNTINECKQFIYENTQLKSE